MNEIYNSNAMKKEKNLLVSNIWGTFKKPKFNNLRFF